MAKALDELDKMTDVLDNKAVAEPVRTMKIIRHLFMGGFWFFDNLYYLATVKLLRMEPESANHWATRLWYRLHCYAPCGLCSLSLTAGVTWQVCGESFRDFDRVHPVS